MEEKRGGPSFTRAVLAPRGRKWLHFQPDGVISPKDGFFQANATGPQWHRAEERSK